MEIAQMTVHCAIFGKGSKGTVIGKKNSRIFLCIFIYICVLQSQSYISNTKYIIYISQTY